MKTLEYHEDLCKINQSHVNLGRLYCGADAKVILPLEHDHRQTDSRARAQRLSAAHHKVMWSILIGFIY